MDTIDTKVKTTRTRWAWRLSALGLSLLCVLRSGALLQAQFQMPDPRQMSGIPRPVDDLPDGSVSVRLIRGALSNNIAGHPVELHTGDKIQTAKTDEGGRAQFDKLPAGTRLKAVAVVDGERLESQEFPAPSEGGIRLLLVATDKEREQRKAAEAAAPAVAGQVVISGDSRIIVELNEDSLEVFYLLDVANMARTPVSPTTPFVFDLPPGTTRAALLQGSSPLARINGTRVTVDGPFPPGQTLVHLGGDIPTSAGSIELTQRFPASFEQVTLIVKNDAGLKLLSPQFDRQQDTTVEGTRVIIAVGGTLAADQPLIFTLSGLPHHGAMPRRVALALATFVIIAGVWAASRSLDTAARSAERRRLVARREKLLQDLVRLEQEQRRGRLGQPRYTSRREELFASLEQVYGVLDDDADSDPADRSGSTAPFDRSAESRTKPSGGALRA